MSTGSLALWLLLTTVGAGDVPIPMKDRTISIPYNLSVNPADVSEVVLYVSIDQGRAWSRAASIRPTERFFAYQAPTDGQYWFTVAVVYTNGSQVPADVGQTPPQQKVNFDTLKPGVRVTAADRAGDEITVTWEVQESNADLATLKLEYRPTDATAGGFWYAVPVSPGLTGQARFRANTPGPITIKLSIVDTAGNLGWAERAVNPSAPATSSYAAPPAVAPITQAAVANTQQPPAPPPPTPFEQLPAPMSPQPLNPMPPAAPVALAVSARNDGAARAIPAAMTATNTPASYRSDQSPVVHCNEPQVTVDYEIERQGPSGVSRVEVYVSQDEGRTWMKWQDLSRNEAGRAEAAPVATLPVTIRLPDRDGLFHFRLVPYSGVELSVGPPNPGDAADLRVLVDRTPPVVELFKPEPEPRDSNVLVLLWKAGDPNLAVNPVRIYWSDQPNGEWRSVTSAGPPGGDGSLPNGGRYNWSLPLGVPMRAYLKVVAVDQAGNVGEAVTPQPVMIDLHKPAGRVRGVVGKNRQ